MSIDSIDLKEYGIQELTNYKGAEGNSHTYVKKVTWADIVKGNNTEKIDSYSENNDKKVSLFQDNSK